MSAQGYFCSTSDTVFADRESLQSHYQSELHKYNLKRKLAGLPPVTKEWFEARKAQLLNQQVQQVERVWFCPLSRKKFSTENTYLAWTRSKKYQDLVKASGQPAPEPVVSVVMKREAPAAAPTSAPQTGDDRASNAGEASTSAPKAAKKPAGFTAKPAVRSYVAERAAQGVEVFKRRPEGEEGAEASSEYESEEEGSEWETASEEDIEEYYREKAAKASTSEAVEGEADEEEAEHPYGDPSTWVKWDPCRCLFCNQMSPDCESSVTHMWKDHGFLIPDLEYVSDLEGLIRYLGLKVGVGHVPLYVRGDDANGKRFRSTHACQRHMVDTNQCRMVFEDNEDEYEDFYDYSALEEKLRQSGQLALVGDEGPDFGAGGYELILPSERHPGSKVVLGHREFARYYRQRVRVEDSRKSAQVLRVNAQYRLMGLETQRKPDMDRVMVMQARKAQARANRVRDKVDWMSAKILDLPQYVPY